MKRVVKRVLHAVFTAILCGFLLAALTIDYEFFEGNKDIEAAMIIMFGMLIGILGAYLTQEREEN